MAHSEADDWGFLFRPLAKRNSKYRRRWSMHWAAISGLFFAFAKIKAPCSTAWVNKAREAGSKSNWEPRAFIASAISAASVFACALILASHAKIGRASGRERG